VSHHKSVSDAPIILSCSQQEALVCHLTTCLWSFTRVSSCMGQANTKFQGLTTKVGRLSSMTYIVIYGILSRKL
jgi:hypothetical protein